MALIRCEECGKDVSDKAANCPSCGAPIIISDTSVATPTAVVLKGNNFEGTRLLLADLAVQAIAALKYRVDNRDEASGTITFTTGMTMGSWSGVSGSIIMREVAPYLFEITGQAKQNVRGGQVLALDLFGEAKSKVEAVIDEMRREATPKQRAPKPAGVFAESPPTAKQLDDNNFMWLMIGFVAIVGFIVLVAISSANSKGPEGSLVALSTLATTEPSEPIATDLPVTKKSSPSKVKSKGNRFPYVNDAGVDITSAADEANFATYGTTDPDGGE